MIHTRDYLLSRCGKGSEENFPPQQQGRCQKSQCMLLFLVSTRKHVIPCWVPGVATTVGGRAGYFWSQINHLSIAHHWPRGLPQGFTTQVLLVQLAFLESWLSMLSPTLATPNPQAIQHSGTHTALTCKVFLKKLKKCLIEVKCT